MTTTTSRGIGHINCEAMGRGRRSRRRQPRRAKSESRQSLPPCSPQSLRSLPSLLPVSRNNTGGGGSRKTCEVPAKGAGQDDGPTINSIFKKCAHNSKIVLDKYYVVDTLLKTVGLDNVEIELSGTVQYTPDIAKWSPQSLYLVYQNATTYWFLSGNNIHMYGGGTIDGNGQVWWDTLNNTHNAGTAGGSSTTFARPIPLTVGNATNVVIENIHEISSPFWNNVSQTVRHRGSYSRDGSMSYSSSPTANSDGWDIYRSDHVTVRDSIVINDDDCVSFKPNSTNILVANMWCNGSHGISVGSLGQYAGETDIVENVYVSNITMLNAQNGARIKVFGGNPSPNSTVGGGSGHVRNVTFKDFYVKNVDNPILINQCYSTAADVCAQYPSNLSISDVHYINVHGTSSGAEGTVVVDLECSDQCEDITAKRTNISPPNGTATYICKNIVSTAQLDFNCTAPSA
ncbi:Glycoside Hydrolase Family 28 protein [Trametes cinnabarina]|uniref:galacturonan 1,4-alpha-galacturonidase n=1 Tax=Pycnoporus cinnabarinus TaxID=5643 RepID=A0A060SDT4_PYCCI|nr:Glycoside Hydrolase Family 28 protein [Trametes cinnabarina]